MTANLSKKESNIVKSVCFLNTFFIIFGIFQIVLVLGGFIVFLNKTEVLADKVFHYSQLKSVYDADHAELEQLKTASSTSLELKLIESLEKKNSYIFKSTLSVMTETFFMFARNILTSGIFFFVIGFLNRKAIKMLLKSPNA